MEIDGFEGWTKVLGRLAAGADLTSAESRGALAEVLAGGATSAQLAAFIVALRLKGETAEEITGLVEAPLGQTVMNDAMILQAAYANGGNEHALDITVQYSKDREQFDKPLGAFQALSHDMADAKTALDGSKVLNYEAAWAHSLGRPVTKLAAMSKLFACNSYRDTTAMAQQIFGGVGFTLEYEIQLYFRRAKQQQITWNDTRTCEDLIAAAVLDESAA